ncbi:unnamed protein product [Linum trigynum]|uniref:UBC core domain-containing protein n=1 Tax=Linum trigynum TaxID=586398 RepID=A0AAV2FHF4_9ROSI
MPPPLAGANGGGSAGFPRFDVASDSSDHAYLTHNKKAGSCFTNLSSGVHKKIMQEWKILEKHLPETIAVRVYENRIDLMTAAVVGAQGTPYHDGLYFFDIGFPVDYPRSPPWVHYRSFGMRINPNLYANGRVCLSLINTWSGKKNEKWNPAESTILQVLISIQALVLNEKPYYNEPGVGLWPGKPFWDKKSNAYSEDAFLLSCKTMLHLVRRPPKNFEVFVESHFRERGFAILSAMMAYKNGECRVGYYGIGGLSLVPGKGEPSEKFKAGIKQLMPQLAAAFARTGAPVGNFVEQVASEKVAANSVEGKQNKKPAKKEKKTGGVKIIFGKLKQILGLTKKKEKKASA